VSTRDELRERFRHGEDGMALDNSGIVRRWFEEVWNRRSDAAIDELAAPEGICHADDGPIRGPEDFRQRQYRPFLAAFPDLHVNVDDVVSQGDQEVIRWTATGTHTGDGLGFAPTGKAVTFRGMTWFRVQDGKLTEGWQSSNIPVVLGELASMKG
jgi:steroid delta-isomerase-like uncharacterized protein